MRIEDELKTSKFQNETQKAHINIIFSAGWIRTKINTGLKSFSLTMEQFNVLRIVRGYHDNGIRVKDITDRMLDRSSNTTRIIDRLVEKGLLLRLPSDRDGRERAIILTANGFDLLLDIETDWEVNTPHKSILSEEEGALLNQLLDKLRQEMC